MNASLLAHWSRARAPILCGVGAALLFGPSGSGAAAEPDKISDSAWRQIRALQKEKLTRSAAHRKLDSHFGVSNAKIAGATGMGMIVKHDGLPGQVDHFAWGPIPSPQLLGQPFPVTITAQDYFDGTASNFNGTVTLSGIAGGGITNSILGDLTHLSSASGTWTLGYAFTPSTDIVVTHVRHYFGSKVSVWTDDGTLLASQNVSSTPGTWVETPLAPPLPLSAGTRYRLGAFSDGGTYYWRADGSNSFSNGAINQSYEIAADNFPANPDDVHWWLVDLSYVVGSSLSFPITPVISGNFTNGLWNGSVTVLQQASNLVLRADDGKSHTGSSSPFALWRCRMTFPSPWLIHPTRSWSE